jgi:hypothetical protein
VGKTIVHSFLGDLFEIRESYCTIDGCGSIPDFLCLPFGVMRVAGAENKGL